MAVEGFGQPKLLRHSDVRDDGGVILKQYTTYEKNQLHYEGYDDDGDVDVPLSVRLSRLSNSGTSSSNFGAGSVKKRRAKRPFLSTLVKKSKSNFSSYADDGADEDDIPISQRVKRLAVSLPKSVADIVKFTSTLKGQKEKQVEEQGPKKRDAEKLAKELENKKNHVGCVRRINRNNEKIQRKIEECNKDLVTKEAQLSLMDGMVRERELELKIEEIELHQVMDDIDVDRERKEEELKALFQKNAECTKKIGCFRRNNLDHKKMLRKIEECVKDLVVTLFGLIEDMFAEHRLGLESKEVELHQVKEDIDKDHDERKREEAKALRLKVTECNKELKTQEKELDAIKKSFDGEAKELDSERKKLHKVMSTKADQHAQMKDFDLTKKQYEGQINQHELKEKHYERRVKELKSKEKHVEGRVKKLKSKEKHLEGGVKEFESKEKEFERQVKEIELKKKHFESQVKELESKEKQFEGRVKELESKEEDFEGHLKEYELRKEHFEIRVKELESKENQLEGRVKEFESKEEKFEGQMKELELKKEHFEIRVKELKSKEKELKGRVREFESKEEEFEDQIKEFESKEEEFVEQVKDLESKKEEFKGQVKELESKEKQFEGRGKELESKDIKFEVQAKEHMSKEKQGQFQELEFKEKQFEVQLMELRSKEKRFKAQVKDLESKRDEFDEQLKELDLIQKQYEVLIKSFEEEKDLDNQLSPTMNGRSLQFSEDESESRVSEILDDLKATLDPSKVVLDLIQNPIVPHYKDGDDGVIMDRSNVFLLEQLLIISPHIKPYVREEAMKLALDLKANMRPSTKNSLEVLGFLLLLSIYGLVPCFDENEILKLFEFAAQHKQAVELFQTMGFADKISDFVQNLINKQQYIEAVRFICAYELVDKNQPVDLLREYVQNAKQISEISCKNTNSLEIKDKVRDQEIVTLNNVLQCISDNNLESEDLLDEIEDRILEINKQKASSVCIGTKAILQNCNNLKERRNVVTKTC